VSDARAPRRRRVAVACQGGGTHAAFTWGVLTEILATAQAWDEDPGGGDTVEVVALSGTSAGALCALAGWYGLTPNDADPSCGSADAAIERLDHLWTSFAARTPTETLHNQVAAAILEMRSKGFPVATGSPYALPQRLAMRALAASGARPEYLGFAPLLADLAPHFGDVDWNAVADDGPRLVVGAIEVLSGNVEAFDTDATLWEMGLRERPGPDDNRWRIRRPLTLEGVAASGTLPQVLPAQPIEGMTFPTCEPGATVTRTGHYWDGLYSQNPPVRELLDRDDPDQKPDEIWVIRINPQEFQPGSPHIGLDAIHDRENDLAGNLSLNQELDHILTMNRWIARHGTEHPPLAGRKVVDVRTIKMARETAWGLHHTTKLDRSRGHLEALREEGREVAARWLADWRRLGDGFDRYPDDARYPEPLPDLPRAAP
jgi:NTE family protein